MQRYRIRASCSSHKKGSIRVCSGNPLREGQYFRGRKSQFIENVVLLPSKGDAADCPHPRNCLKDPKRHRSSQKKGRQISWPVFDEAVGSIRSCVAKNPIRWFLFVSLVINKYFDRIGIKLERFYVVRQKPSLFESAAMIELQACNRVIGSSAF